MVFVQILKKWLPVFGTLERVVRDDEPVMRLPGVHPEAALLASAQHEQFGGSSVYFSRARARAAGAT